MAQQRLVIEGAALFDPAAFALRRDISVVVAGSEIVWVGPRAESPEGGRVLRGDGLTMLPGLIDSHVHLCVSGHRGFSEEMLSDSPPLATLRALGNAKRHLLAGVTTVRDCGARHGAALALSTAVATGLVAGPTIQAAGAVITMTGGHAHFMGYEADGPAEVRKATRQVLKEGAQFVKVIATGGVLTEGVEPGQSAFGIDELRAIVEEAHNAGRRVAAHAIGVEGIKSSLRAGVDSIEHGFLLDDETFELFRESGAFLVPTLSGIRCAMANADSPIISPSAMRKAREVEQVRRVSFERAVRAGVKVAAGTDAGTPFNYHGQLACEIATMVEYGMTPAAALAAATIGSATNLGIAEHAGSLEPGKRADLVLVDGDPLTDLAALSRVVYVASRGQLVVEPPPGAPERRGTSTTGVI